MNEFIYFVIGIIVSLILSGPGIEWFQSLRTRITWKAFIQSLRSPVIVEALTGSNKPEVIIGLNGGVVAAAILALNYFIDECYFVNLLEYVGPTEKRPADPPRLDLPASIKGRRILIVDDQYISGTSMQLAVDALVSFGVPRANIKRLAIFRYKVPGSGFSLDIPAPSLVTGRLKWAPWVISEQLERFYKWREKNT